MRRFRLAALCAALAALAAAAPARGAIGDPTFVFVPVPPPPPAPATPPPSGYLKGPCGLAVDSAGRFYVADYHHHAVDVYSGSAANYTGGSVNGSSGYAGQLAGVGPLDGPCGLALDASGNLYVNDYHRSVARYSSYPSFGVGAVFAGATVDSEHPTGVAADPVTGYAYVDDRTYVAVYDSSGVPVDDGGSPLKIGLGDLGEGYGVALDASGRVYVPDAATDTVKVYDPAIDKVNPAAEIEKPGGFVSLRDSAIAVDRGSGEVYVADNAQPRYTEKPQATIYAFGPTGAYHGHLKYNVADALPPGLAVDRSAGGSPGRVYVTSGNTTQAGIYAYPAGSATTGATLPPTVSLALVSAGSGEGAIASDFAGLGIECAASCEEQIRSGAEVTLAAAPGSGSTFAGWSGGGCSGTATCTVQMEEATAVRATFEAQSSPPASTATASGVKQRGELRVAVSGRLSPKRLPGKGAAPISVSVGWQIASTDESPPPDLKALAIEINRHGRFDYEGLPTCPIAKIQAATAQRALANCRAALVGRGSFSAEIAPRGQEGESYETAGRLLVFNGESNRKPALFAQIYSAHPLAISFVITFALKGIPHGAYGTALTATLPKALRSWGNLTGIEMRLARRFGYQGASHSFISAGCPAPKNFPGAAFPLARTSFAFAGGTKLTSTLTDDCKVRG
jgi:hypothetical protein